MRRVVSPDFSRPARESFAADDEEAAARPSAILLLSGRGQRA